MDLKLNLNFNDELQEFFEKKSKVQRVCPNTIITERLVLLKEKTLDYSIILKGTKQEIGNVIIVNNGEIWYEVYEPFRGNGYATEAVVRVIEELKDDIEFYLSIDSENKASKKVAKKLGFVCKERIRCRGKTILLFEKK